MPECAQDVNPVDMPAIVSRERCGGKSFPDSMSGSMSTWQNAIPRFVCACARHMRKHETIYCFAECAREARHRRFNQMTWMLMSRARLCRNAG